MKIGQIVKKLRADFANTLFDDGVTGTRVGAGADFEDVVRGSKVPVPAMFCLIGDDVIQDSTPKGSNASVIEMVETLVIMLILSGKADSPTTEDEFGADPTDKIHDIKLALIKSLHGFNPFIADKGNNVNYGYNSKELRYSNGGFFDFNREYYIYRFEFQMSSSIDASCYGVGSSQPISIVDLLKIYTDIEPVDVTIGELTQPRSKIEFSP